MIQFQKLNKRDPIEKVIIVSLDLALYQVNVLVDGQELLVSDKKENHCAPEIPSKLKLYSKATTSRIWCCGMKAPTTRW